MAERIYRHSPTRFVSQEDVKRACLKLLKACKPGFDYSEKRKITLETDNVTLTLTAESATPRLSEGKKKHEEDDDE